MTQLYMQPPRQQFLPQIPQDKPVYRILSEKGFFGPDDTLHPEGEIIILHDEPNEDMEPLNDLARKAYEAHLDKLDAGALAVAEKHGRAYLGRPRTREEAIDAATMDARRVQTLDNKNGTPLMGAKKKGKKRIEALGEVDTADTGRKGRENTVEILGAAPNRR